MSQKTRKRKPSAAAGSQRAVGTPGPAEAAGPARGPADAAARADKSAAASAPQQAPAGSPATPAGPPPLRLTAAAAVAGLEGLAVAAWGVTMFFGGSAKDVAAGLLVLALAALPLLASYGLRRARRWSRGPALIMQLICLPISWDMLHSDGGGVVAGGAVLAALALSGLVLLVHPATSDALGIKRS